jgi:hypothetical protein
MTDVELSRRERKKEETKERIFKAAFALFKRQGVEATTVEEILATWRRTGSARRKPSPRRFSPGRAALLHN